MPISEATPLLWSYDPRPSQQFMSNRGFPYYRQELQSDQEHQALPHKDVSGNDAHQQFCTLTGCPPSNLGPKEKFAIPKKSLYGRCVSALSSQRRTYNFSASLNNILLLSQVILGAALTALGASASSHILITIFGATNTIIAGLVAYLKSRGQPMRARMYRDDLERIVDEIENSEVMWRGISAGVHGYDEIDTDEVTVRSEVARLTRLYDRAVRLNGMNNPDMYMAGAGGLDGNSSSGLRGRPMPAGMTNPVPAVAPAAPQPSGENAGPAVPTEANPEDQSPATKVDMKKDDDKKETKEESKSDGKKSATDGASDPPASGDASVSKPMSEPDKAIGGALSAPTPPDSTHASSSTPTPAPSQPAPQPVSQPPTAAAVPNLVDDPDASPATAARLKPKRARSDKNNDAKKVSGDDEEQ